MDMQTLGDKIRADATPPEFKAGAIRERFVVPPFSVLDTKHGDWQSRRRWWLGLGIQSEIGRGLQPGGNHRSDYGTGYNPQFRGPGAVMPVGHGGMTATMAAEGPVRRGDARAFAVDMMRGETASDGQRVGLGRERAATADQWALDTDSADGPEEVEALGVSIFDPVLAELAYRWWCPAGGLILDPFAGGSVRGIVAAYLGHRYVGVDLSGDQVQANRAQADTILTRHAPSATWPRWEQGDSAKALADFALMNDAWQADMVFTCPPYYDLEVYSDHPSDLSAAPTYAAFLAVYRQILALAVERLRPGRFAAVVVSEVRDKRTGNFVGLVPDTIRAMEDAGATYYNEAILVNSAGSLALRVTKQFEAGRKLGRQHQNVLVFLKGAAPRGWSYDRVNPPSPQLSMDPGLDIVPAPAAQAALASDDPDLTLTAQPTFDDDPGALQVPSAQSDPVMTDDDLARAVEDALLAEARDERPWEKWADPAVAAPDWSNMARTDDGKTVDRSTGEILETGGHPHRDHHAAIRAVIGTDVTSDGTPGEYSTAGWKVRVRRPGSPPGNVHRDFTLRCTSDGGPTELVRARTGDLPPQFLYAWAATDTTLDDWVVVDTAALQVSGLLGITSGPTANRYPDGSPDGSAFVAIGLDRLADRQCITRSSRAARAIAVRMPR